MHFSNVVLPAPRNPDSSVTGMGAARFVRGVSDFDLRADTRVVARLDTTKTAAVAWASLARFRAAICVIFVWQVEKGEHSSVNPSATKSNQRGTNKLLLRIVF